MQDAAFEILSETVKRMLPGSVLFLLAGVTVGVALLLAGDRRRGPGRAWLTGLVIAYWLLSLPVVAGGLERMLGSGFDRLESAELARGARTVVVLTGGGVTLWADDRSIDIPSHATAYRMLEAERLYRMLGEPLLLVSGGPAGGVPTGTSEGEAMQSELVGRGIPSQQIEVEGESADTRQQALRISQRLKAAGIEDFVLVTSRPHMRRALGAFRAQGLDPIPSAATEGGDSDAEAGLAAWLPSPEALGRSEQAMREIFALVYYRLRGWLE